MSLAIASGDRPTLSPIHRTKQQQQQTAQSLQQTTIDGLHQRIYHAAQRYRRHLSGFPSSSSIDDHSTQHDLRSSIISDGDDYLSPSAAMPIVADKVSLPQQSGTADLLAVLPPHLASVYSNPQLLLQPPAVKLFKRRAFKCDPPQYKALLLRMLSRDMISFTY